MNKIKKFFIIGSIAFLSCAFLLMLFNYYYNKNNIILEMYLQQVNGYKAYNYNDYKDTYFDEDKKLFITEKNNTYYFRLDKNRNVCVGRGNGIPLRYIVMNDEKNYIPDNFVFDDIVKSPLEYNKFKINKSDYQEIIDCIDNLELSDTYYKNTFKDLALTCYDNKDYKFYIISNKYYWSDSSADLEKILFEYLGIDKY